MYKKGIFFCPVISKLYVEFPNIYLTYSLKYMQKIRLSFYTYPIGQQLLAAFTANTSKCNFGQP